MKAKTLDKKLTLNKATVSNLSGPEMQDVRGGSFDTCWTACHQYTCDACNETRDGQSCGLTSPYC